MKATTITTAAVLAISFVVSTVSAQSPYQQFRQQQQLVANNQAQQQSRALALRQRRMGQGGTAVATIGGVQVQFGLGGTSSTRIGGNTRPVPFTDYVIDSRGQRWKIEGVKWMVGGQPMQRITSRTPLRNDVQYDSGTQVNQQSFDPYSGTFHRNTSQTTIYDSASDAYRNHVDAGSKRYVNRIEIDPRTGEHVRVAGYEWTSYGKYHADLDRTRVRTNAYGDTDTHTVHALRKSMAPIHNANLLP